MKITHKFKLFIVLTAFFVGGHAPWGQHEVYRQMHMLVLCSKNDGGAFDFTKNLKVMDATALTLARDHNLPITVFNVNTQNALKDIICGEKIGTLIS